MIFIISYHIFLVLIGIYGIIRHNQIKHESNKRRKEYAFIEMLSECIGISVITFGLILVGEYFNRGLTALVNEYWWIYFLLTLIVMGDFYYHFYTLPFIGIVGDIVNDDVTIEADKLKDARLEINEYQLLVGQRVGILACMAPLGILLPFMTDIFIISHVSQIGVGSVVSLGGFFVYGLLLWHNYKAYAKATKLLTLIDKQMN
ncbi:MAG: hypothetical protein LBV67_10410 [Streptococcaceae bacterium]|nr:hypothetical protein [Streptococcaceae bacterium]